MKTTKQYGKKADTALSMWVKLVRAATTFGQLTNENIRSFGLTTPQFGALECLGHLGPMPIGELCKRQLVSGGNMTVVIDNLEKEGFVERIHSKEDRRTILVQLTAKGQKLFNEIFAEHAQYVARVASVLTAKEQNELGRLAKKLGISLKQGCPSAFEETKS